MKTLPLLAPLCLTLLFAIASAQEPTPEQMQQMQQMIENQIRWMNSPMAALNNEADYRCISPYNGQGTWQVMKVVFRAGGQEDLALTEEQINALPFLRHENEITREYFQRMQQQPSEEFLQGMQAVREAIPPDDRFFEKATDEQKRAYVDAQRDFLMLSVHDLQQQIETTLTSEQMLKLRKLEMQLMPEFGIPYPSMFEVLDLTDEQKKEMRKIADEMGAEYDDLLGESAALRYERIHQSRQTAIEQHKQKPFESMRDFQQAQNSAMQSILQTAQPVHREKWNQLQERGVKFTTQLQTRLMDVLTDEQLDKMAQILNETPEFAKKVIAEMAKGREAQKKSPTYTPGPDSWRPGNPLPEQFKEERKSRFPRSE